MALGWRVRRIMRTKEVVMRIKQIHEFDYELETAELDRSLVNGLKMSKYNTKLKLGNLIRKMQEKGLWLTYSKLEDINRPSTTKKPPAKIT